MIPSVSMLQYCFVVPLDRIGSERYLLSDITNCLKRYVHSCVLDTAPRFVS